MKKTTIYMSDIVEFCENYNAIGYGEAKVIEVPYKIVITLYNAGYSDNEEQDELFQRKYNRFVIYDNHPITIIVFPKITIPFFRLIGVKNLKDNCDCYEKKKKFTYNIEVE